MRRMMTGVIDQLMKQLWRVDAVCRDSGGAVIRNGKWSYLENAGEHPASTKENRTLERG
jgi:hypothetical protein